MDSNTTATAVKIASTDIQAGQRFYTGSCWAKALLVKQETIYRQSPSTETIVDGFGNIIKLQGREVPVQVVTVTHRGKTGNDVLRHKRFDANSLVLVVGGAR